MGFLADLKFHFDGLDRKVWSIGRVWKRARDNLLLLIDEQLNELGILQFLQSVDPFEELGVVWSAFGSWATCGLGVGDPVEIFQVESKHRRDGPSGSREIKCSVQGDGGKEPSRVFLVIQRGVAECGARGPGQGGLGQGLGSESIGRAGQKKRDGLQFRSELLLVGDVGDRQAARGVGVSQADDIQEELLLGSRLDRFVVLKSGLDERTWTKAAPEESPEES